MYEFKDFDFLWHEQLGNHFWRVVEDFGGPQKICIYVVEGRDRTLVFDSGLGATHGLRKYIETFLTNKKPMCCVMSHSHPDHIGGCTLFDELYIHPDELPQLAWGLNDRRRVHDAAAFAYTGLPGGEVHGDLERALAVEKYCEANFVPTDYRTLKWNLLRDGDVFDIGGQQFECIHMTVHGSLILYNREMDFALTGDNFTYTLAPGNIDCELLEKFENFAARITDKTMLYSGHLYFFDNKTHPEEIDARTLQEVIRTIRNVIDHVDMPEDKPLKSFYEKGAPTLMGFKPRPEDSKDIWNAYEAQHPERKGKKPQTGQSFVHMAGPVIVTYKKPV